MSFAHELKKVRKSQNMTQLVLASRIGIDQSRISAYESGEEVPGDLVASMAKVLNSPRLSVAYAADKRIDVINIPSLTNVNEDVVNVLDVVMEEAEELILAGKKLKKLIRNKKCRADFTEIEMDSILTYEEQIADMIPCIKLHFVRMAEVFDLDISRVEQKMIMKLKRLKLLNWGEHDKQKSSINITINRSRYWRK